MTGDQMVIGFLCCGLLAMVMLVAMVYAGASTFAYTRRAVRVELQFTDIAIERIGRKPPFFYYGENDRGAVAVDPDAGRLLVWTSEVDEVRVLEAGDVVSTEIETRPRQTFWGGSRVQPIDLKLQIRDTRCPYLSLCFLHAPHGESAEKAHEQSEQARLWEARINASGAAESGSSRLTDDGD